MAAAVSQNTAMAAAQARRVTRQPQASISAWRTGGRIALLMPLPVNAQP